MVTLKITFSSAQVVHILPWYMNFDYVELLSKNQLKNAIGVHLPY